VKDGPGVGAGGARVRESRLSRAVRLAIVPLLSAALLSAALPAAAQPAAAQPAAAQPAAAQPAAAQPAADPGPRIDALFSKWRGADSPGCSVGVSRGGRTVFERGYGRASLEHGAPITPATVFHVASVTKPLTALSVLLLAESGALSLDDDVARHVPGWSNRERITIRQLLSHTSGIRDAFLLIELASPDGVGSRADQLVGLLARQRGVVFTPGSAFAYNNGGYTLLGDIVRRVSGQSLRAFADARIFVPLGMPRTRMHDDPGERIIGLASRYTRRGDTLRIVEGGDGVVGNGGMVSTTGDLLAWLRNFDAPRVGSPSTLAAMQTSVTLTSGDPAGYGLGLFVDSDRGRRRVAHGGGDAGISAYAVRYPDHDLAIAILCNLDEIDTIGLAGSIADLYLGAPPPAAAPGPTSARADAPAITLPAARLAAMDGLYRDPRTEALLRIFVRDGTLMGSPGAGADGGWPTRPVAPDRFVINGTSIVLRFVAGPDGAIRTLHVDGGTAAAPTTLERVAPFTPPPGSLAAFAGAYRSDELDSTYTLAVTDGQLTFRIDRRPPHALQPIRTDAFAGPLVGVVTFTREPGGAVSGFTVHGDGSRGIRFERSGR
jgi:CubicO group peptidase (beta-lactamase class C family)